MRGERIVNWITSETGKWWHKKVGMPIYSGDEWWEVRATTIISGHWSMSTEHRACRACRAQSTEHRQTRHRRIGKRSPQLSALSPQPSEASLVGSHFFHHNHNRKPQVLTLSLTPSLLAILHWSLHRARTILSFAQAGPARVFQSHLVWNVSLCVERRFQQGDSLPGWMLKCRSFTNW